MANRGGSGDLAPEGIDARIDRVETATGVQRRIEHSKSLLGDPTVPLPDVALRSGFASQSPFSTAFRPHEHDTPVAGAPPTAPGAGRHASGAGRRSAKYAG